MAAFAKCVYRIWNFQFSPNYKQFQRFDKLPGIRDPILSIFLFSYKLIQMNSSHMLFQNNIQVGPSWLPAIFTIEKSQHLKDLIWLVGFIFVWYFFLSNHNPSFFYNFITPESAVCVISEIKCRVWGRVCIKGVSFVTASFSMRLYLLFTRHQLRPLAKPGRFENAAKSGAFSKRYRLICRINGETASIWVRLPFWCEIFIFRFQMVNLVLSPVVQRSHMPLRLWFLVWAR